MNIVLNFTPHLHKLHNCIYMCSTPHLHKLHNWAGHTPYTRLWYFLSAKSTGCNERWVECLLNKLPSPQQCSQTVSTYYTHCYSFQLAFCHTIRHASMWFCSTIEPQQFELPSERVPPLICTSCITVRVSSHICTSLMSSAQSCTTNKYCTEFHP